MLERDATVSLRVLDVTGRVVRTLLSGDRLAAGLQRVAFDDTGLAPGVYHVQLGHDGGRAVARFIVLP